MGFRDFEVCLQTRLATLSWHTWRDVVFQKLFLDLPHVDRSARRSSGRRRANGSICSFTSAPPAGKRVRWHACLQGVNLVACEVRVQRSSSVLFFFLLLSSSAPDHSCSAIVYENIHGAQKGTRFFLWIAMWSRRAKCGPKYFLRLAECNPNTIGYSSQIWQS